MAPVVIIGGGQAGFQLALSLRQKGYGDEVTLVCEEAHLPYMRPPLSKGYMKGETKAADLFFRAPDFFEKEGIRITGRDPAVSINIQAREVRLQSGQIVPYARLVLATGARARRLTCPGSDLAGIFGLRTLDDAASIHAALPSARSVCVVGGGFIGLEFAAIAAKAGKRVTVIEAGDRLMARALSPFMSQWFMDLHLRHGVDVRLQRSVSAFDGRGGAVSVAHLSDETRVEADLVVVGIGVMANQDIAETAGLAVQDGITVDASLRTSATDVYAIGDCVRFPSPFSPAPVRLESVQNAVDQAKYLADVFVGREGSYGEVPWFWSEQHEAKLQIAGLALGYDDMRIAGEARSMSFSAEYYRQGDLIAVDSINDVRRHLAARKQLAGRSKVPA